jgi:hypothetical protein
MFHSIKINSRSIGVSLISAGGSDLKKMKMHAKILNAYDLPCIIVVDKNRAEEAQKIEAAKIPNVRKVFALQKGNFEEYLPLEIMVEVLNKLCEGNKISAFDINKDKPIENQLKKLVHDNYPGSRFEHLKISLGQEVGKLMVERHIKPDPEIIEILTTAQKIATA